MPTVNRIAPGLLTPVLTPDPLRSAGGSPYPGDMKIIHQSYPAIGGPTDGRMLTTPWSRVWVHIEASQMQQLAWCESLLDDWHEDDVVPRAATPLQQSTLYLCPDSDVGYVLLDIVGNTRASLAKALHDIEGVYVYDHETLSMRWVQLRTATPPTPGSSAARHLLLAEFTFREHALAEKAYNHIGRPDDALALRVMRAHPDDPDVELRAKTFERRRRSRWSRFEGPSSDGTLPGS